MFPNNFSQPIGQYISQLQKINLLSETIVYHVKPAFEFSNNNSRIKCEICSKLTIEAPAIILFSLLLTLNIFDVLF